MPAGGCVCRMSHLNVMCDPAVGNRAGGPAAPVQLPASNCWGCLTVVVLLLDDSVGASLTTAFPIPRRGRAPDNDSARRELPEPEGRPPWSCSRRRLSLAVDRHTQVGQTWVPVRSCPHGIWGILR